MTPVELAALAAYEEQTAQLLLMLALGIGAGMALGYLIGVPAGAGRVLDVLSALEGPEERERALAEINRKRGRPAPRGFELHAVEQAAPP